MEAKHTPERWPVLDCLGLGHVVPHLEQNAPAGPVCQGRAFRDGKWQPWGAISATVYENRKLWPRKGYEVRIAAKATQQPHSPAMPGTYRRIAYDSRKWTP